MVIKCKLCNEKKVAKGNTHFLSDFIIRTALNLGGSNERNTGEYFGLDTGKETVDYTYQQISSEHIEEVLGRPATDDEIDAAIAKRDFAVDDSFCQECEDKFKLIEEEFASTLITEFRETDLTDVEAIGFENGKAGLMRLFFLMQFWRVSVCTDFFKLPAGIAEKLKQKIFDNDKSKLENIPLSITYMQTINKSDEADTEFKTDNVVNPIEGENPYIIMMNDFVIQMFEPSKIAYSEFFGLNHIKDFLEYLNYGEENFEVKVISNQERKVFNGKIYAHIANKMMTNIKNKFTKRFIKEFNRIPLNNEVAKYMATLTDGIEKYRLIEENNKVFNDDYFLSLKNRNLNP